MTFILVLIITLSGNLAQPINNLASIQPDFFDSYPYSVISRAGSIRELPINLRADVANFSTETYTGTATLKDYVYNSNTDGVIIIHKGEIVFEEYPRMEQEDKHLYFSITKPFVSTMIAILEDRDVLDVSKPVDHYMPELKNSAWEGIPVLDILDMCTGINCREKDEDSYNNPNSCFMRFFAAIGFTGDENTWDNPMDFLLTMDKFEENGLKYDYTGVNTWVLSQLIERVTGEDFPNILSSELWQKMGAESDAQILTSKSGYAVTPMGMSSNLRDLGRFGLLFTPSGRMDSGGIISEAYLKKIVHEGRPELFASGYGFNHFNDETVISHNTYQWDHVTLEGDFFKSGYGGQGLYISPSLDLVIAFFGTHRGSSGSNDLPKILRQMIRSGLFKI
jgi:CubicO group peptidase (beta-lactamase class C family)